MDWKDLDDRARNSELLAWLSIIVSIVAMLVMLLKQ